MLSLINAFIRYKYNLSNTTYSKIFPLLFINLELIANKTEKVVIDGEKGQAVLTDETKQNTIEYTKTVPDNNRCKLPILNQNEITILGTKKATNKERKQ